MSDNVTMSTNSMDKNVSLHTVILNDELEPVNIKFPSTQSNWRIEEHWLSKVEENRDIVDKSTYNYSFLYTIANGPHTEISSNPILQAFISAYNQHHDIVLSPDDMWMLVCLKFAEYINHNAERLRSLFVRHAEGKIELSVGDFKKDHEWNEFFDNMKATIGKNVKEDVCHLLTADFSTTGKVESILSTACIMHTFKPYFDYRRMKCVCGIRQAHFMGTLADWQLLRVKTEQLKVFGNNEFCRYIDGILPIFDEFIQTYQGKVNKEFWTKVCDITRRTVKDYYDRSERLITGWVLQLFGLKADHAEDPAGITLPNIRVPVKLEDCSTGKVTQCYVVGGFHGVYSIENRHKPVMSLSVVKEVNSIFKKKLQMKDQYDSDEYPWD